MFGEASGVEKRSTRLARGSHNVFDYQSLNTYVCETPTKSSRGMEFSFSQSRSRAIRAANKVSLEEIVSYRKVGGNSSYQSGALTVKRNKSDSMRAVSFLTAARGSPAVEDRNCSEYSDIEIGRPNL